MYKWKKRRIFFELPYCETLLLCHNLDVTSMERSVYDKLIGTLLNIDEKTKYSVKDRLDLEVMGIRQELTSMPNTHK